MSLISSQVSSRKKRSTDFEPNFNSSVPADSADENFNNSLPWSDEHSNNSLPRSDAEDEYTEENDLFEILHPPAFNDTDDILDDDIDEYDDEFDDREVDEDLLEQATIQQRLLDVPMWVTLFNANIKHTSTKMYTS